MNILHNQILVAMNIYLSITYFFFYHDIFPGLHWWISTYFLTYSLNFSHNVLHTYYFFFCSLGELQYLNLESNSLGHLPKNLLHKNVHKKLLDVRLSYNKLRIVDTHTFSSLKTLQTVTMTGNLVSSVETLAFHDLPNLKAIILTHNQINNVAPR